LYESAGKRWKKCRTFCLELHANYALISSGKCMRGFIRGGKRNGNSDPCCFEGRRFRLVAKKISLPSVRPFGIARISWKMRVWTQRDTARQLAASGTRRKFDGTRSTNFRPPIDLLMQYVAANRRLRTTVLPWRVKFNYVRLFQRSIKLLETPWPVKVCLITLKRKRTGGYIATPAWPG